LNNSLKYYSTQVFSLENRQIQLQLALEERTKEIEIHNDMLRVQLKNAEEERHSANAELRDRIGKVEKLRRRYEILMTQFAPEEGEEEHSQAYYVIKAAQERENLQREGDELDAKIRKAEKEIKALENTLKLMNDRNEDYRMKYFNYKFSIFLNNSCSFLVYIKRSLMPLMCNTRKCWNRYRYLFFCNSSQVRCYLLLN
jgi:coiled-coil domain-containing protein 39